jgi:hypothetical protein
MLTNQEILNCYNNIIDEVCSDHPEFLDFDDYKNEYGRQDSGPQMTQFHWDNLVKVCSIIKANSERFNMESWHDDKHPCGTAHCIAGWTATLMLNDTNIFVYDHKLGDISSEDFTKYLESSGYNIYNLSTVGTSIIAIYMLSNLIEPFFYLTRDSFGIDDDDYNIESIIMRHFIDVVLERAKEESHELSSEFQEFVESIKTQPCLVSA